MKRPAFQFYPGDWRNDLALRKCSLAARGMWIEIMCIAHECEPYGTLRHNGEPLQADDIAGLVGMCSPREAKTLIDELVRKGVAKVDADGVIYSKRMVRDEEIRNARAEGGKAGGEHGAKGAEQGAKGGRPTGPKGVGKGGSETPLPTAEKPPLLLHLLLRLQEKNKRRPASALRRWRDPPTFPSRSGLIGCTCGRPNVPR